MVAAWMKIAVLMLKTPPAAKKQQTHRQNAFAEHQNAFTDDAPTGAGEFCKRLTCVWLQIFVADVVAVVLSLCTIVRRGREIMCKAGSAWLTV
jgi:uncharacterized protein (DUF1800 family)